MIFICFTLILNSISCADLDLDTWYSSNGSVVFSCVSYANVDQQENIDITSDTPQQNEDCPREIFFPLADAPSEEEASTDVGDSGEFGQSSIDPSINSRLEQLVDPLEASPAAKMITMLRRQSSFPRMLMIVLSM